MTQSAKAPERHFADCRARLGIDLIGNTWNAVVLYALDHGSYRPGELREPIGGISTKVLTQTLRRLEGYGLVSRRVYAEAPPRVEYSLTALGRSLLEPLRALGRWADEYGDAFVEAQGWNRDTADVPG
ncbi:winged helix-turn-helix transcriptional regulator [Streptomyces sp. 7N604]|uniref:winged helix-turn-helix transcriptional regulator n=1 Tax=Streptomyces sp. 7N604 TaxID=3457415 RepID=UPI003FD071F4